MKLLAERRAGWLVLASGLCALTYQSAWIRQLRLLFGASTAASAAVLAIFMGGLGLGAWWWGGRAELHPRPLRLYARLEAGVAVFALLSLPALAAVRAVYLGLGGEAALGSFGASALRLLLSALVLGLPAFCMGGTLPAILAAAHPRGDQGRNFVARVYGLNTLGAVLGVVLTSFWALETIGISRSILGAVVLNLGIAAAAWAFGPREATAASAAALPKVDPAAAPVAPPSLASVPSPSPLALRALWLTAGVFGFVFFAMELVWYRVLAPLTGGTTWGFGFVLAVALAGIGIGGLAYARRRGAEMSIEAVARLAAWEAIALGFAWLLGDAVPVWATQLRSITVLGRPGLFAYWLVLCVVVVFPAACVAGYQFPALVACLGRGREAVATQVGRAYAFNTVGSVLGAMAAGFGLIPALGVRGLWIGCASALMVTAFALWRVSGGLGLRVPVLLATGAAVFALGAGPTPVWMHNPIGAGRIDWEDDLFELVHELEQPRSDLVWAADGKESSVAILGRNAFSFRVNGKTDGNATGDASTVVMAPLIGTLLHPEPRRGLVIGLGTGMSAGWMAAVPSMEQVDVVELEPALLAFAEMCAPVNRDALDNPKVEVVIGDAREWVQTVDRRWDVVMSEPSNPYRAGIASLFSVEFYQSVRARMSEDGVFVQWLQAYEIDAEAFGTVLVSLREVFESVDVFVTSSGDYALVARMKREPWPLDRLRARLAAAPYDEAMDLSWGVEGLEAFLAAHVAGPGLADSLAQNAELPREHDDRPRLEFGFARSVGGQEFVTPREVLDAARASEAAEPWVLGDFDRRRRDEARQVLGHAMDNDMHAGLVGEDEAFEARRAARAAIEESAIEDALASWQGQAEAPRHPFDRLRLGALWADAGDAIRAEAMAKALEARHPVDAALLRARLAQAQAREADMLEELMIAVELAKQDPWFDEMNMYDGLGRLVRIAMDEEALDLRPLFEALGTPFAVDALGETRVRIRLRLARRIDFEGLCLEVFAELEPDPPFDDDVLEMRVECYAHHEDPRLARAEAELSRYEALGVSRSLAGWFEDLELEDEDE